MNLKSLRLIPGAVLLLGMTACTGVPVDSGSSGNRASISQQLKMQHSLFAQGKTLFLNKQYGAAATILLSLAKQGHIGAQYTIGYMYHYGYGVPRNEKESVRWIATAAGRGHLQAKEALTRINASHDRHGVREPVPPQP